MEDASLPFCLPHFHNFETIRPYWLKGILDAAQNSQSRQVFHYFLLFGLSTVGTNFISTRLLSV